MNKVGKPTLTPPSPQSLRARPTLRAAATPPCGALPYCGVRILSGALML